MRLTALPLPTIGPIRRLQAALRGQIIPYDPRLAGALGELDAVLDRTRNPSGPLGLDATGRMTSCLCNEEHMRSEKFIQWFARMRRDPVLHRKLWEWAFISQVLEERSMLKPGRKGVGFAVGTEPLASLFCSCGCEILATDFDAESADKAGWVSTGQHAASLDALNQYGLADSAEFRERTRFRVVDMRQIPGDLGMFDFVWSACAIEHLGNIDAGIEHVLRSYDLLRPGGIAVHTTEFNMDSDWITIGSGNDSIFRRCDLELLAEGVRARGGKIELDFREGDLPADLHVDRPPYRHVPHLRLGIYGYRCTSFGLVIEKPA